MTLLHLNIGCMHLPHDLDFPLYRFDTSFGGDIAVGVQRGKLDLRLGYRLFRMERKKMLAGVDIAASSKTLDMPGIYLEAAYRFRMPESTFRE